MSPEDSIDVKPTRTDGQAASLSHRAAPASAPQLSNEPHRAIAMPRILLVDDDMELVEMIREYLEPEGFAVDVAYDSETCLANDPERKDLIVLDVMLPGLSGFEVLTG